MKMLKKNSISLVLILCMILSAVPATVLYPALTGGTILISAVAGMVCFKEKITKKMLIGLLICFAGTCMFL